LDREKSGNLARPEAKPVRGVQNWVKGTRRQDEFVKIIAQNVAQTIFVKINT
jgi:hypothetical protein